MHGLGPVKIFLPYRGEFGWIIMSHAPQVKACHDEKAVCCEPGNEALYPGVRDYWYVDRIADERRRYSLHHDADFVGETEKRVREFYGAEHEYVVPDHTAKREYFLPEPHEKVGVTCDVVVCPRRRLYGPDKNWEHWAALVERLQYDGYRVFAAGAPDSSYDVPCSTAWQYRRHLDASIEAIRSARLVVATDNGVAHLAVLCGTPLALISYRNGRVAPGEAEPGMPYWGVKMDRYERENHRKVPITLMHNTWDDLDLVVQQVEFLAGRA